MSKMLKNKLFVIGIFIVVLLIGVGVFFFLQSRSGTSGETVIEEVTEVVELQPEDIGLELSISEDNKIVTLAANKLDDISSIEYDVSYDAEVTEGGDEFIATRGVTGVVEVAGQSSISKDIDLGTCSRNVCKYDNVVSAVTFNIRVNFSNGEVGGIEAQVDISE